VQIFHYKAIGRTGQDIQGNIKAPNSDAAVAVLAEQGRFVQEINAIPAHPESQSSDVIVVPSRKIKISEKEKAEFFRQLTTALQARLPILSALKTIGQQNPHQRIKQLTDELSDIITSGQSFSSALGQYPHIFNKLHVSLVLVGENSGTLDSSLDQLADLTERQWETRNDIMTAALYPAFVLCLGIVSVAIVVTWILPQILAALAAEMNILPWPTRLLLTISGFLQSPYGWLCTILMIFILLVFMRWRRTAYGKLTCDKYTLLLPVIGTVHLKWAISRFARTLGTLINAGVGILEALQIVRNCLDNELLAQEIDEIARQVRTGSSLAEPLRVSGRFPPLLVQIISVGENTGHLADMLLTAADAFDKETSVALKRFMTVFPAVLITLLALVVGFIVAATLLPIVQIGSVMPTM